MVALYLRRRNPSGELSAAQILADLRLCCSDEVPDLTPLPTLFPHHFIHQGLNYSSDYPLLRHAYTRRPAVPLRRWIDWSGKVHTDGCQQKWGGARTTNTLPTLLPTACLALNGFSQYGGVSVCRILLVGG